MDDSQQQPPTTPAPKPTPPPPKERERSFPTTKPAEQQPDEIARETEKATTIGIP